MTATDAIDAAVLPSRIMFDTGVLLRAWGERPNDARSPICVCLYDAARTNGKTILVAAPTIAEILRFGSSQQPPIVRGIQVVAFDSGAARVAGEKLPYSKLKELAGPDELTYFKYDALIVACAVRHGASAIVTLERKGLLKMAATVGLPAFPPEHYRSAQMSFPG